MSGSSLHQSKPSTKSMVMDVEDCSSLSRDFPYSPTRSSKHKRPEVPRNHGLIEEVFTLMERDPVFEKRFLLEMALQEKTEGRSDRKRPPSTEASPLIQAGFMWRDYPELESVLEDNMPEYYGYSFVAQNVADRTLFNNQLTETVRTVAQMCGYTFDSSFDERKLRDRIRCYYKTNLQNIRKRLRTMKNNGKVGEIIPIVSKVKSDLGYSDTVDTSSTPSQVYQKNVKVKDGAALVTPPPTKAFVSADGGDSDDLLKGSLLSSASFSDSEAPVIKRRKLTQPNPPKTALTARKGDSQTVSHDSNDAVNLLPHFFQGKRGPKQPSGSKSKRLDGRSTSTDMKDQLGSSAMTHTKVPRQGTYQGFIWKRIQEMGLVDKGLPVHGDFMRNAKTLHTLICVRLAGGLYRSAMKLCHSRLIRMYEEAEKAAKEASDGTDSLKSMREKLAIMWCQYAHVLLEVGALSAKGEQPKADGDSSRATIDWKKQAIATLSLATDCPLAGNHSLITLALSRILVLGDVCLGSSDQSLTGTKQENIRAALAVSWDGLDRAHDRGSKPRLQLSKSTEEDAAILARHEIPLSTLQVEPVTAEGLEQSFASVLELPKRFQSNGYLLVDKESASAICCELNRLSRLSEKLDGRPRVSASCSSPACTYIESFSFYRFTESGTEDSNNLAESNKANESDGPATDEDLLKDADAKTDSFDSDEKLVNGGSNSASCCIDIEHACKKCLMVFGTIEQLGEHEATCHASELSTVM